MTTEPQPRPPKFLENSFLAVAFFLAHAPLWYQLPRWAQGLDPTFVHPKWIAKSPFPLVLYMAAIHPLVWITLMILICIRAFRNYGWRVEK